MNVLSNAKHCCDITVLENGSFNAKQYSIRGYFATSRKEAHEGYQLVAASVYALSARYQSR